MLPATLSEQSLVLSPAQTLALPATADLSENSLLLPQPGNPRPALELARGALRVILRGWGRGEVEL